MQEEEEVPRTVLELKQWLTSRDIVFPINCKKKDLEILYQQYSSQSPIRIQSTRPVSSSSSSSKKSQNTRNPVIESHEHSSTIDHFTNPNPSSFTNPKPNSSSSKSKAQSFNISKSLIFAVICVPLLAYLMYGLSKPVEYCNSPSHAFKSQISNSEQCVPCPKNTICYDLQVKECVSKYIMQKGICVLDPDIKLLTKLASDYAVYFIHQNTGKFLCHGDYYGSERGCLDEDGVKEILHAEFSSNLKFFDVLSDTLKYVKTHPAIQIVRNESSGISLYCSKAPHIGFSCKMKNWAAENTGFFGGAIGLIVLALFAHRYISRKTYLSNLASRVTEYLKKNHNGNDRALPWSKLMQDTKITDSAMFKAVQSSLIKHPNIRVRRLNWEGIQIDCVYYSMNQ
jgi:hypothetical protein